MLTESKWFTKVTQLFRGENGIQMQLGPHTAHVPSAAPREFSDIMGRYVLVTSQRALRGRVYSYHHFEAKMAVKKSPVGWLG